jgi:hypothetical protein
MANKKSSISRFLFELFIVFIGVYGAFELNRYQDGLREQRIERNYFNSFLSEVVKISHEIKNTQKLVNSELETLEQAIESGMKPPLKPIHIYFGSEMLITRAGFNDDVFTQLSPELSASLSGGFDNIQVVSEMVKNFNMRCNLHLIANQPIAFYDRQGALKPEFQWYINDLKGLSTMFAQLSEMINNGAMPAVKKIIEDLS